MKTIKRALFCLCLFGLLAACGGVSSVKNDYVLDAGSNQGLLLCSLTYSPRYGSYQMFYRRAGGDEKQRLKIGSPTVVVPPALQDWDIEQRGMRGQTFAVALPPGRYEFFGWQAGSGQAIVTPSHAFSVIVEIAAGKATYAGNFHFEQTASFGATVTGVNVYHVDEAERDLKIVAAKYPRLDAGAIVPAVARGFSQQRLGGGNRTQFTIRVMVPIGG